MKNHEHVVEAQERYDSVSQRAFDSGVVNVIAGGNQGALAQSLAQQGVAVGEETFRSLLVNQWTTVVGAATAEGKLSGLNSPNGETEVYALGENVPFQIEGKTMVTNGTSVSAPLISSHIVHTLEAFPNWTPAEVEASMTGG